jgi:hypothetical protein
VELPTFNNRNHVDVPSLFEYGSFRYIVLPLHIKEKSKCFLTKRCMLENLVAQITRYEMEDVFAKEPTCMDVVLVSSIQYFTLKVFIDSRV